MKNYESNIKLLKAIRDFESESVEYALNIGADIECIDDIYKGSGWAIYPGSTPLILAVRSKQIKIVKILLKHGANIEAKDQIGCTSLDYAYQNNDADVIQILIEYKKARADNIIS